MGADLYMIRPSFQENFERLRPVMDELVRNRNARAGACRSAGIPVFRDERCSYFDGDLDNIVDLEVRAHEQAVEAVKEQI